MLQLQPGDLVVVRTPGIFAWMIRAAEMLQGRPDLRNHVAMFHHSAEGVNWYLEGRPGGFGWQPFRDDADPYMDSTWTISNSAQAKTDAQRTLACSYMRELLGAPYDWSAIEADLAEVLRLPGVWAKWNDGTRMPGHVVCSSAAAWAYRCASLAAPELGGGRLTEPADWDRFIMTRAWEEG
jgi:hypothetical protein